MHFSGGNTVTRKMMSLQQFLRLKVYHEQTAPLCGYYEAKATGYRRGQDEVVRLLTLKAPILMVIVKSNEIAKCKSTVLLLKLCR